MLARHTLFPADPVESCQLLGRGRREGGDTPAPPLPRSLRVHPHHSRHAHRTGAVRRAGTPQHREPRGSEHTSNLGFGHRSGCEDTQVKHRHQPGGVVSPPMPQVPMVTSAEGSPAAGKGKARAGCTHPTAGGPAAGAPGPAGSGRPPRWPRLCASARGEPRSRKTRLLLGPGTAGVALEVSG